MSRFLKLSTTTVLNVEEWETRPANTADILYVESIPNVGRMWDWDNDNQQFYLPDFLVPVANTVANNGVVFTRINLDGTVVSSVTGTAPELE